MKRFLKTFALLIVSLFVVVSGVDKALDHLSNSASQNSVTIYNEQGAVIVAYQGDLNGFRAVCVKPGVTTTPIFLHRT